MFTLTEITVDEVMINYMPAYPGNNPTWQKTVDTLLFSSSDREVVDVLRQHLRRDGTFRDPVTLETEEYRNSHQSCSEEDNFEDPSPLRLLDGTHRVVAAYLEKHQPPLPVRLQVAPEPWNAEGTTGDSNDDRVLISSISFDYEPLEETVDHLMDILGSFEASNTLWVSADLISDFRGDLEIIWGFRNEEEMLALTFADHTAINNTIRKRLNAENIEYSAVSTYVE